MNIHVGGENGDTDPGDSVSTGMPRRRTFALFAILEALSIVPLSMYLPRSAVALEFAAGILTALNACVLVSASRGVRLTLLESANLAVCGACLVLALKGGHGSLLFLGLAIGLLCLLLFTLGIVRLPDRALKQCFAAQQLALASTLILWVVIRHFGAILESGGVTSAHHLRAGLRLLFAGPLGLVAVAFFAGIAGRNGYLTALAGICIGQWAVGLFELGAALQVYALVAAGFALLGVFVLLLVLGAMSVRRPKTSGPNTAPSLPPCS